MESVGLMARARAALRDERALTATVLGRVGPWIAAPLLLLAPFVARATPWDASEYLPLAVLAGLAAGCLLHGSRPALLGAATAALAAVGIGSGAAIALFYREGIPPPGTWVCTLATAAPAAAMLVWPVDRAGDAGPRWLAVAAALGTLWRTAWPALGPPTPAVEGGLAAAACAAVLLHRRSRLPGLLACAATAAAVVPALRPMGFKVGRGWMAGGAWPTGSTALMAVAVLMVWEVVWRGLHPAARVTDPADHGERVAVRAQRMPWAIALTAGFYAGSVWSALMALPALWQTGWAVVFVVHRDVLLLAATAPVIVLAAASWILRGTTGLFDGSAIRTAVPLAALPTMGFLAVSGRLSVFTMAQCLGLAAVAALAGALRTAPGLRGAATARPTHPLVLTVLCVGSALAIGSAADTAGDFFFGRGLDTLIPLAVVPAVLALVAATFHAVVGSDLPVTTLVPRAAGLALLSVVWAAAQRDTAADALHTLAGAPLVLLHWIAAALLAASAQFAARITAVPTDHPVHADFGRPGAR